MFASYDQMETGYIAPEADTREDWQRDRDSLEALCPEDDADRYAALAEAEEAGRVMAWGYVA